MMRWPPLVFLVLLLVLPYPASGRTKTTIDYDALEKSWQAGDDDAELRTEGDDQYQQLAATNEDEAKTLGPQMVFVTMKEGGYRHQEPLPDVASRWKEMLWNGGVEVNIYEVAESKLLVGLQKGLFVNDVMRFLDAQVDLKEMAKRIQTAASIASTVTDRRKPKSIVKRKHMPHNPKAQQQRAESTLVENLPSLNLPKKLLN